MNSSCCHPEKGRDSLVHKKEYNSCRCQQSKNKKKPGISSLWWRWYWI